MNALPPSRVVVAFAPARARGPLVSCLKPQFSHCFMVVKTTIGWVGVDPLRHWTAIAWTGGPHDILDRELCNIYVREKECTAALSTVAIEPVPRWAWPAPFTCVEVVKRALGITTPLIFTPWQLYRHLIRAPETLYAVVQPGAPAYA